ncbi:MAG: hypothetical protein K8S98_17675 [Planctomycetes bacterium]|nr:hypothetical protein [Planctomycetota bacterium]
MQNSLSRVALFAVSLAVSVACSSQAATNASEPKPGKVAPDESFVGSVQKPAAAPKPATPAIHWTQAELEELSHTIQEQVADLRGSAFTRPVAVRLANKDQFFDYAKKRQDATETPEKIAADETLAKLFGVVPADIDLMATTMEFLKDQVGGFYDPSDDSFSLMDQCPKGIARIILAHELGHALDDQLHSIDSREEELTKNTDASYAYHAVVEGSGTSVMTQWAVQHMSEIGLDMAGLSEMQEASNASMAKAPMWLWKPLIAVYLQGAAFLSRTSSLMAGQMGGAKNEDIDAAFKNPPRSMEQVLHPEKYWTKDKLDEPVRISFDAKKLTEDGWAVLREDTFGEFLLAILVTPPSERKSPDFTNATALLGMKFTNDVARGWGGDRVVLLGRENGRCARLVTRWDTPRDASEFYGAMTGMLPTFEAAAKAVADLHGPLTAAEEDAKVESGAEVEYGKDEREVTISIWSRAPRGTRKAVEKGLVVDVAAD